MYFFNLIRVCVCAFSLAHKLEAFSLTNYRCLRNDLNGVDCLRSTIPDLSSKLKQKIDPLNIPLSAVSLTAKNYKADYTDIVFTGASNLTITEREVEDEAVKFDLTFPILKFSSTATGGGNFKGFEFEGFAKLLIDFYDVVLNLKLERSLYVGLEDLSFSRMNITVVNLFAYNPERNEAFNKLVNERSDALYDDYKYVLVKSIGRILPSYIEKIYTKEGNFLVFEFSY